MVLDANELELFRPKKAEPKCAIGLNVSILNDLPVLQGHDHHPTPESAHACQAQLQATESVLLKTLDYTIEMSAGPLPDHLPDFSRIKKQLANQTYIHADECMADVYEVIFVFRL